MADHDLRATQVVVEYDASIDHDLRVTQVIIEYDWLAPEEESTVAPLAFMHLQRQRRER